MPTEENDDTTANEDVNESEETVDEDLPSELPETLDELRKVAATAISRLTAAQTRETALLSEKERLEEGIEEQRTKATYWATDAERLRAEIAQGKTNGKATAKDKVPTEEDGLSDDMELAVAVTEGVTLADIDKRAAAIARQIVNETTENLSRQGRVANAMTGLYGDLKDSNSPLTKATVAEMTVIDQEMPGLSDDAKFELATRRSAERLGITPKANGKSNGEDKDKSDQKERERRRAAQGGPIGKATQGKGAIVITDADRAEARKMNGGQDVPDDVLKRAKRYEAERTSAQQARA